MTDDVQMERFAARARARAGATDDPEERARLEEAAAVYEGHTIPPSGALLIDDEECEACDGTGNWTGWSGDDEHTQEGGCPDCDGTGRRARS